MKFIGIKETLLRQRKRRQEEGGNEGTGSPSRQRAAGKLLCAFFALMLLFTLFSRAASGMTIPEVTAEKAKSDSVGQRFTASGIIQGKASKNLSLLAGIGVETVLVKQGDSVKEGDPLIELDREAAARLLEKLKNELAGLEADLASGGATARALKNAQQDYDLAERDAQDKLSKAEEAQRAAKDASWKAEEKYQQTLEKAYPDRLKKAQYAYDDAKAAHESAAAALNETDMSTYWAVKDADKAREEAEDTGSPEEIKAARRALSLARQKRDLQMGQAEAAKKKAERELADAGAALNNAKDRGSLSNEAEVITAKNEADTSAKNSLSAEDALKTAKQEKERALLSAQRALDEAKSAFAKDGGADAKSGGLQVEVAEKREAVERLRALRDGYILTAPADGKISLVNAKSGEKTDGQTLVTLDMGSRSGRFEGKLPKDQAKKLAVGDYAAIKYLWDGQEKIIDTVISGIGAENEDGYCIVTADLEPGTYSPGQSATLECRKNGKNYGMCLPISALRSDQKGEFIYVLQEKETVMGKEYAVKRVGITVIDRNNDLMAVQGDLSSDDLAVTSSTKSLEEGNSVRVKPS